MSMITESLWPDVIRAEVQSPSAILLAQAEALTKQTSGVLMGKVGTSLSEEQDILLHFSIVVPDLGDYRHRIMVVQHGKDMLYPARIDAEVFRPASLIEVASALASGVGGEATKPKNRADSDKEFIELVRKVLASPYVISVAQSLIARVSDVRSGKNIEPLAPEISATSPGQESEPSEEDTSN